MSSVHGAIPVGDSKCNHRETTIIRETATGRQLYCVCCRSILMGVSLISNCSHPLSSRFDLDYKPIDGQNEGADLVACRICLKIVGCYLYHERAIDESPVTASPAKPLRQVSIAKGKSKIESDRNLFCH